MAKSKFQHLPLPVLRTGPAQTGRPPRQSDRTRNNRTNFEEHATVIQGQVDGVVENVRKRMASRSDDAPEISAGVALVLEVDPDFFDLELLRHHFDFEVVLEDDDGFVIVAAEDLNLTKFRAMVDEYSSDNRGSATIASIHRVDDDEDQIQRLKRILSDRLFAAWSKLSTSQKLTVDVSVECTGTIEIPNPPSIRKRDSDLERVKREAEWSQLRLEAYLAWEQLQYDREQELGRIVDGHSGEIVDSSYEAGSNIARLPDCFSVRLEISGAGLRDLVLNYPYIFEVVEPDDIELPILDEVSQEDVLPLPDVVAPPLDAATVCIIDSGIQEGHPLIRAAIDVETSYSFLPDNASVADEVSNGGHGTRVAGTALFGESIAEGGTYDAEFWIQNARVLDSDNSMPRKLFPATLIESVVDHFHEGKRQTRIFNHSINARTPCRRRHMSAWSAAIDKLSFEKNVLIVQSAGNVLPRSFRTANPGVGEHLDAGRSHPEFLYSPSFRIANPAHSFQALTVGSVSYASFNDPQWASMSPKFAGPSAFSRTGLSIWDAIKPDVVEFGGDYLRSVSGDISTPEHAADVYPQTVRSTLDGGPAVARDSVGTSFTAPKVTRLAAKLQAVLPDEPCLLYRALIAQSARWPEWASESDDPEQQLKYLRNFGYGIPDEEKATSNNLYRSTLISHGEQTIAPSQAKVFQIPIPVKLRRPGDNFDVLVEVTLSYAAQPRRTRRGFRGYLSTWLEWKASGIKESTEDFRSRVFKDEDSEKSTLVNMPWQIKKEINNGIEGVRRAAGTLQKDWAIVESNQLPDTFCIAVLAHKGWSKDPGSTAKFSLAVSFESVTKELEIHETLEVAVNDLMIELESEVEV